MGQHLPNFQTALLAQSIATQKLIDEICQAFAAVDYRHAIKTRPVSPATLQEFLTAQTRVASMTRLELTAVKTELHTLYTAYQHLLADLQSNQIIGTCDNASQAVTP